MNAEDGIFFTCEYSSDEIPTGYCLTKHRKAICAWCVKLRTERQSRGLSMFDAGRAAKLTC
jgi:hypothetical protein